MTFKKAFSLDLPVEDDGDDRPDTNRPPSTDRPTAVFAIVDATFEAAITPVLRRRLHAAKALAIIVILPTIAWLTPIESWFKTVFGNKWKLVAREKRKAGSVGIDENLDVARYLARGYSVAGFATDVEALPISLVRSADIVIRIPAPSPQALRDAIANYTGRPSVMPPDGVTEGLDLSDLVAAFRPGTSAKRILTRLQRVAETLTKGVDGSGPVPNLETALEYGKARTWGLNLAAGIKAYKQGMAIELPRGLLLAGPPGTGKSLYSRALAAYCRVPIASISIADLFAEGNKAHLDDVVRNFGNFMDRAVALAENNGGVAIAFIDEIDSLPNRLALSGSHNADYWKPVVNYVLTRLDDSRNTTRKGVIVVAATNDAAALDPALLRPGRLELTINIEPPDFDGTVSILRFHAPDLSEADLREVAAIVEGNTGAELMYMVREARSAALRDERTLTAADLKSFALPESDLPPAALLRIACHEAGHATARLALLSGRIKRCVIGGQKGSGGHVLYQPDFADLVTKQFIENEVIVALAGRAAEAAILGTVSAGAGGSEDSDLGTATRMIATMHATSGMGDTLAYLAPADQVIHAMNLDVRLQARVERDLQLLQQRANVLILKYRTAVEAIAYALRDKRHLSESTIRELFAANAFPSKSTTTDGD